MVKKLSVSSVSLCLLLVLLVSSLVGCAKSAPAQENAYVASVKIFVDNFYEHRREYNAGLELIGTQVRSARNNAEYRQALQQAITLLDNSHQLFRQDMDDFAAALPPPKFQNFYLLMNSVLRDYVEVTAAFALYYSQNLNLGTQDLQLADHAQAQLRTANENLQRAALMLTELTGER